MKDQKTGFVVSEKNGFITYSCCGNQVVATKAEDVKSILKNANKCPACGEIVEVEKEKKYCAGCGKELKGRYFIIDNIEGYLCIIPPPMIRKESNIDAFCKILYEEKTENRGITGRYCVE